MNASWLLIMTWFLVLVKVDFELIDMLSWCLVHVTDVCMFSYKETWLAKQGKVTSLLLCLFMHWQLCVYGSMMEGMTWIDTSIKYWRRLKLRFPLEALGTMGLSHGVFFYSCSFGLLWFVSFNCSLVYVWSIAMPLCW